MFRSVLFLSLFLALCLSASALQSSIRKAVIRRHGDRSLLTRAFMKAEGAATEKYCKDASKKEDCKVLNLEPLTQSGGHTCWSGTTAMILRYYFTKDHKCPFKIFSLTKGKGPLYSSFADAVKAGHDIAKEENAADASEGNVAEGSDTEPDAATAKPADDPHCLVTSPTVIAAMGKRIDTSSGEKGRSTESVIEAFGAQKTFHRLPNPTMKWGKLKAAIDNKQPIALGVKFRDMRHAIVVMGYREMPAPKADPGKPVEKSTNRQVLVADPYPRDRSSDPREPVWRAWDIDLNSADPKKRQLKVLGRQWAVEKIILTQPGTGVAV